MTPQDTPTFTGFENDGADGVYLPEAFFTDLLPKLAKPTQLQLLLYFFWHLQHDSETVHYLRPQDLLADPTLSQMIGEEAELAQALAALVEIGALLRADLDWLDETYYFINGPQGRAAVQAIEAGEWRTPAQGKQPVTMTGAPPNIFKLYEDNIGPITPMMAEILKEDEAEYPAEWIEEAIRSAVAHNARSWKYVQAILKNKQKEGHRDEQHRRNDSQDAESYRERWLRNDGS
ncbi:DnaD domain protein [bacterium]|nr:DnaD domain protein [bacterium]